MVVTVDEIEQRLDSYQPRRKLFRPLLNRASVALIITDVAGEAQVLMIKRAVREGDPWSGDMAFPGGLMEPDDRHGLDVACRETEEETGLLLGQAGRCIGRLSELMTHFQLRRRAMVITPYVFRVDGEVSVVANPEVAEVVWVPMAYLANPDHRERMTWKLGVLSLPVSCYRYQGRCIWGLSLIMLDELSGLLNR